MKVWDISLFFLNLSYLWQVQANVFTSTGQMTDLIYRERDLVQSLKKYVQEEEERLSKIKRWAAQVDEVTSMSTADPEGYLGHPVNAYKLVKRLNKDWLVLQNMVLQDSTKAFIANLTIQRQLFPTDEDETGAASALMRLQDIYMLDPDTLAKGKLPGTKYISSLSVDNCFDIAKVAYNDTDYYNTMLWMQEALKLLDEGEESTVSKVEVLDYLSYTVFKLGDAHRAAELTKILLVLASTNDRIGQNLSNFETLLEKEQREKEVNKTLVTNSSRTNPHIHERSLKHNKIFEAYKALCRGEGVKMTPSRQKGLYCRYQDRDKNPLLVLNPAKEEDEWDSPRIVRYHEMLSDEEIEKIKELAKPKLATALVLDYGKPTFKKARIAKSAWLKKYDDPVISHVDNRMQAITGLAVDTAEMLQVANYGIGGHYEPHTDFFSKTERYGDRIATLLNYMSDVQVGGATVFPEIGAALWPKKGTAVFWYNLFRSGEGDYRTLHAACPVLVGNKWASNKWFRERGQEFRRPCGITKAE